MGTIYLARHRQLDELRVIKMLRPGADEDEEGRRRFHREAVVATRLRHPNIAITHDFIVSADGTALLVMEFVPGCNLRELLRRRGAVPVPLAIDLVLQTLSAMGHLHRRGVVHRDISPDNIMLSRSQDGLIIKLIDLGIAKSFMAPESLTASGMFIGKIRYSSPEQLLAAADLDGRADLYALGIVLHELITGALPFRATGIQAVITERLRGKPLTLRDCQPDLDAPAGLEEILTWTLSREPADRPSSADELATALRGLPVVRPGEGPFQKLTETYLGTFPPEMSEAADAASPASSSGRGRLEELLRGADGSADFTSNDDPAGSGPAHPQDVARGLDTGVVTDTLVVAPQGGTPSRRISEAAKIRSGSVRIPWPGVSAAAGALVVGVLLGLYIWHQPSTPSQPAGVSSTPLLLPEPLSPIPSLTISMTSPGIPASHSPTPELPVTDPQPLSTNAPAPTTPATVFPTVPPLPPPGPTAGRPRERTPASAPSPRGTRSTSVLPADARAELARLGVAATPEALLARARDGDLHAVETLLAMGVRPDAVDASGNTALHISSSRGDTELTSALLAAGASPQRRNQVGLEPLHRAAIRGHAEVARLLLAGGADRDAVDPEGSTPLLLAAGSHSTELVELLLQRGARPDVANKAGVTPLMVAVDRRDLRTALKLLEAHPDLLRENGKGLTALMISAGNGDGRICRLLIDQGADPAVHSGAGLTAIEIAERRGHPDLARFLREYRPSPSGKP
jgi:serine/threonine-protein kinase